MNGMKMDKQSVQERHEKRKNWFIAEASRQSANRSFMAKCEAFYDGQQWDHEDAETIKARGQNPVVYNEIKPTIDWLIGTERRARVDFFVVAEQEGEEAAEDARLKSKVLKYIDEVNNSTFERSYAAEDAFKAGVGWIEVGLRGDKSGSPVYMGAESWRNILWDSMASRRDLSDARYIFRIKVVDLDVAIALFPDKKTELENCAQKGDDADLFKEWFGGDGMIAGLDSFSSGDVNRDFSTVSVIDLFNARERVLLLECWSREPHKNTEKNVHGIADPVTFKVACSVMTMNDTLVESWSPYRHDHFPFVPYWAYRNRRTGLPYSPILPLIGAQESLNARMSRSLYEASANQIKVEVGAIDAEVMDIDEIRKELDSPDGTAIFAAGALSGGKVQERKHQAEARFHIEHANLDARYIRQISGVAEEQRGLNSSAQSGKAVLAKQDQGGLLTLELFDNFLYARQQEGDMTLSMAEQYMSQPVSVRVAGESSQHEFTGVNQLQADGTVLNDITARQAKFVVGEQAWKQAFAESAFESLMQVMTQLASAAPQIVVGMLDVVFEMHPNLPRKKLILERIRQVNGQSAPDGKLSPEQEQAKMQQNKVAAAQFEMQMEQMKATIREAQAKGEKLEAEAMAKRLESLYMSAQAAQVLSLAPQITPVADELLKSAGFKDLNGGGVIDPSVQQAVPVQPMQQQMIPPVEQADGLRVGMQEGIQTPVADGVDPALQQL